MRFIEKARIATIILSLGLLLFIPAYVSSVHAKVAPVQSLKLTKLNGTSIKLKWAGAKNCDGFIVYRKENGRYKIVAKVKGRNKRTYTDRNTNSNLKQTYAVKAYRNVSGKTDTSSAKKASSPGYNRYSYIAHRGNMEVAPENTMAAFQKAYDLGYKVFECDVWYTDSHELLISHSNNLDSICKVHVDGGIYSITSASRYNYPIKVKYYQNYAPQYFPTMQEVLAFAKSKGMKVLFHFRYPRQINSPHPALAISTAANYVRQANMTNDVIIISSVEKDLQRFTRQGLQTGYVSTQSSSTGMELALTIAKRSTARWVLFPYTLSGPLSKKFIKHCHDKGFKTINYNIVSPGTVKRLVRNGCDAWVVNKTIFIE